MKKIHFNTNLIKKKEKCKYKIITKWAVNFLKTIENSSFVKITDLTEDERAAKQQ